MRAPELELSAGGKKNVSFLSRLGAVSEPAIRTSGQLTRNRHSAQNAPPLPSLPTFERFDKAVTIECPAQLRNLTSTQRKRIEGNFDC